MKSPSFYQTELGTSQTLITLIPHWNKLSSFLGGFMLWGWTAFTRIVFTCKTNKIFLLIFLKYSINSETTSFTTFEIPWKDSGLFLLSGFWITIYSSDAAYRELLQKVNEIMSLGILYSEAALCICEQSGIWIFHAVGLNLNTISL